MLFPERRTGKTGRPGPQRLSAGRQNPGKEGLLMNRQEYEGRAGRKDGEVRKKEGQGQADVLPDKELDAVTGGSRTVGRPPLTPKPKPPTEN